MIERRKVNKVDLPPAPTEHEGKPIIARLLLEDEDITYLSSTKTSLSISNNFLCNEDFIKDACVDVLFIGEKHTSKNVYRYKMTSKSDDAINLKLLIELGGKD